MFSAFIIGNIASGKSTASRYLESRGARRLDLDQMAKDLYYPGSPVLADLSEAFGPEVVADDGGVDAPVLARRAFADPESTAVLNGIVHPVLIQRLADILVEPQACSPVLPPMGLTVVEVSVPMSFRGAFDLADEVVAITAPLEVRRRRAVARGMSPEDFDARSSVQPTESELCGLATVVIDNAAGDDSLFASLDGWMADHGFPPEMGRMGRLHV